MRLLLDTHILLWSSESPERLSRATRALLEDPATEIHFSVVSLWEIGVKRALGRPDFRFDPHLLRTGALAHGYREVPLIGEHALAVNRLPKLHRDPFDTLLLCQSLVEDFTLLSNDALVLQYPVKLHAV